MNVARKKVAIIALILSSDGNERAKKLWIKDWIRIYGSNGHYENVYYEWRRSDPEMFMSMLRVWPDQFDALLHMVGPLIAKQDTQFRDAIRADKRLTIGLRYLASGKFNLFNLKTFFLN